MAKAEYRSAIRSRRLIIDALADILQEKPLDKITVTEVVKRADINRGTFYAHYADIPDVLDSLVEQTFSTIRDALSKWEGPLDQVPLIGIRQVQVLLEENMVLFRKIMDSGAAPVLQEKLTGILLEYMLEQEQKYAMGNHEEYVLWMRFCVGGLIRLYKDWFAGELNMSLEELSAAAIKLVQNVVRT